MLDNAGKTITFNAECNSNGDWSGPEHAYDVIPTDDYFLNCYWNGGAVDHFSGNDIAE